MKKSAITALAIAMSMLFVADAMAATTAKFDKVEYLPPKVAGNKNAKESNPVKGDICFDKDTKNVIFIDEKGHTVVTIPYDKVKSLLYEKTSHPRYTEAILISPFFLFSKTKKHFLTIQYTNAAGDGQFAMIHMDKSNARDIVAEAEAETGKKVEMTEEK
jgi:hypothetical protein